MRSQIISDTHSLDDYVKLSLIESELDKMSNKTNLHNKKVSIPLLKEYVLEKQESIRYRDYNTPSPDKVSITPAYGNFFSTFDFNPTPVA